MTVVEFATALADELEKQAAHHEDEARRWRHVREVSSGDLHRARAFRDIAACVRRVTP
jgi:hypothetical protein